MRLFLRSILCVLALFIVTACGGAAAPTSTPRPTVTPTPLSTALPPAPTVAPFGSAAQPYHLAIVNTDRNASGGKLSAFLSAQLNSVVEVDIVETQAEALALLCSRKPSAAILDGRGVLAALAQNCGALAFRLQGADGKTGTRVDLIVRDSTDKNDKTLVKSVADLRGKDFCRISGVDLVSWLLPELAMKAGGLNPATDLKGIKEFTTTDAMLLAVAGGACAGAGIPAGSLNTAAVTLPTGTSFAVLATTPEYPNGGLMISGLVPASVADQWIRTLGDNPDQVAGLIGNARLIRGKTADLTEFTQFARNAGLDMASIGK